MNEHRRTENAVNASLIIGVSGFVICRNSIYPEKLSSFVSSVTIFTNASVSRDRAFWVGKSIRNSYCTVGRNGLLTRFFCTTRAVIGSTTETPSPAATNSQLMTPVCARSEEHTSELQSI